MKFLKADGTIEEGIGLTDSQAAEMTRIEEMMHIVVCQNVHRYDWQGIPKCRKVANAVTQGTPLLEALEDLKPKPRQRLDEPEPEITVEDAVGPDPVPESPTPAVEKDEMPF